MKRTKNRVVSEIAMLKAEIASLTDENEALGTAVNWYKKKIADEARADAIPELKTMLARSPDSVRSPSHYTQGKVEVMELIEQQELNFARGNCVKYICRAGKKDESRILEDLEKAAWYLLRDIEKLRAAKEGRDMQAPIAPGWRTL